MIPARFRRKVAARLPEEEGEGGSGLYLMKAPDGSLELYEPAAWSAMRTTLSALSDFNPEERLLKTLVYESLELVGLDRQGRIPLSREFLEHAGISNEVVIIGADTKMVVWEPTRLSEVLEGNRSRFGSLAGRYF